MVEFDDFDGIEDFEKIVEVVVNQLWDQPVKHCRFRNVGCRKIIARFEIGTPRYCTPEYLEEAEKGIVEDKDKDKFFNTPVCPICKKFTVTYLNKQVKVLNWTGIYELDTAYEYKGNLYLYVLNNERKKTWFMIKIANRKWGQNMEIELKPCKHPLLLLV